MTEEDRRAREAAQRVVDVCDVLADISAAGFDDFVSDVRTQWAVEMGLIRIGEGINRIPADVLDRFPGQRWRAIIAMRKFAAQQYDDLEPRRVWRTVAQDVPALRAYLIETLVPGLDSSR